MARATQDPIQTLWIGSGLTRLEKLALTSFVAHGHAVHLYTYSMPASDAPAGVHLKDAREILPEDQIFVYGPAAKEGQGSVSAFSNVFRYKLLLDRGGWWVDADVVCVKPFPDCTAAVARERHPGNEWTAASCVLHFPAGDPVPRFCYEEAGKADRFTLEWGQIGPRLVDRAVEKYGYRRYLAHPDEYCPFDWFDAKKLVEPGGRVPRRAYAVHLWNEMLKRAGIDKRQPPPDGSVYDQLSKRYHIPSEAGVAS